MTSQQYLEFLKAEHLAEEEITAQRNGDYSGKDNDAFSNFRRYGEIQLRAAPRPTTAQKITFPKLPSCPGSANLLNSNRATGLP